MIKAKVLGALSVLVSIVMPIFSVWLIYTFIEYLEYVLLVGAYVTIAYVGYIIGKWSYEFLKLLYEVFTEGWTEYFENKENEKD